MDNAINQNFINNFNLNEVKVNSDIKPENASKKVTISESATKISSDKLSISLKKNTNNPVFDQIPSSKNIFESKSSIEKRIDAVIDNFAQRPMKEWVGWAKKEGQFFLEPGGTASFEVPFTAMAKLEKGIDTEEVNRILQTGTPYSKSGTNFAPVRKGDYDFGLSSYIPLVYKYWDSPNLKPETKQHIAKVLLNEEGSEHIKEKWMLGIIPETENHLLMTEGSRYLKNQIVNKYGMSYSTNNLKPQEYDNKLNGFNDWFVNHLSQFTRNDFDEYNSKPYQTYTIKAIQNIYEYADDPKVKTSAHVVMDYISAKFAVQSSDLRRVVPYRRRQEYMVKDNLLEKDGVAAKFAVLSGNFNAYQENTENKDPFSKNHMLASALMSYRVPDIILDLMIEKGNNPYFMTAHHKNTEIVYSEENFEISAGGHYDDFSKLPFTKQENGIVMPTVIMFKNAGPDINDMLRFLGRGDNDHLNNTGVYENFAFGIRPVLPDNYKDLKADNKVIEKENWKFFETGNTYVAFYSKSASSPENYAPSVGFTEVVDKKEFSSLKDFMNKVEQNNQDKKFNYYGDNTYKTTHNKTIQFEMAEPPEKSVFGNIKPPKTKEVNEWPVKKVWEGTKEIPIERNFDKWQLADSFTKEKENDGQNNDYVIKADGSGQILINDPKLNKSLLMSVADHDNPIRIEQNCEVINLSEKAKIKTDKKADSIDISLDLNSSEKVRYLSLKWDKKSKPEDVSVYVKKSGSDKWEIVENRNTPFNSEQYDFRTDFDLTNSPKIDSIKFVIKGKNLNLEGIPEVYKSN